MQASTIRELLRLITAIGQHYTSLKQELMTVTDPIIQSNKHGFTSKHNSKSQAYSKYTRGTIQVSCCLVPVLALLSYQVLWSQIWLLY